MLYNGYVKIGLQSTQASKLIPLRWIGLTAVGFCLWVLRFHELRWHMLSLRGVGPHKAPLQLLAPTGSQRRSFLICPRALCGN